MKIRLVTVVWGRDYADTFLRTGLRTLIADGNCPDLARAHDVIYTIYTSPDTVEVLEAAPAFALLRQKINVRLHIFAADEIDATNYGSHGVFWNRELELARQESAVLFFIIPDVLYAENTLTRWAARFEAGAGAIFTIGPQVALETIVPEIESRFPNLDGACCLGQEELYDLLFRHFHPLHVAMRHDSDRRPSHPEYDLRLVPGHGFVIREIVSHPFCINPRLFNSLRHYGPRDHLDSVVVEPCLTLSVEPVIKRVHGFYRPWPLDEARLSNMAVWYNYYAVESCEYESAFPYDISASKDAMWPTERRRAVAGGRFYRSQIISAGRLYKIFAELRQRQLHKAASILALAVYAGRLRRRLSIPEGATILVPSEDALEADRKRIDSILAPGREKELIDLIADHVILRKEVATKSGRLRVSMQRSDQDLAPGEGIIYTARGLPAETLVGPAVRSQAPFKVGPFTVILIDRVLWRDTSPQVARSEEAAAVSQFGAPASPASAATVAADELEHHAPPDSDVSIFVVTKWGRRSNLHRAFYLAAHVPFLEPLIASLLHPVYYPRVMQFLQTEKRAYRFIKHVPRAVYRRLRDIPAVGPLLRRILHIALSDISFLQIVRRILQVVRRDGIMHACRRTLARLKALAPASTPIYTVSKNKLELIDEIRNVRTIEVCAEVLDDFQSKMVSSHFKSAPLAFLQAMLSEEKPDGKNPSNIERCLVELTETDPEWSDPWLELGFLHEDQGRLDDALSCFSKAMKGKRAPESSNLDPHPAAIAATRRGHLLANVGNDEAARLCFEFALSQEPGQRLAAIEYAGVLRRLGHINQALVSYCDGMDYQETRWAIPNAPREAGRLRFPHLTGRMAEIPGTGYSSVKLQGAPPLDLRSRSTQG